MNIDKEFSRLQQLLFMLREQLFRISVIIFLIFHFES